MFLFFTFLPEVYLFSSIFILFLFGIIYTLSSSLRFPKVYNTLLYFSILILFYTFLLLFNNNVYYCDYNILLKNQSNIYIELFFILISIIIFIVTYSYNIKYNIITLEYIILLFTSLACFLLFINIVNLLYLFLLIEIQSIITSILISINKNNRYSIESSIKYFILGSYSSLLLLFGISILYGCTGFINIYNLSMLFDYFDVIQNDIVLLSIKFSSIFILIGLLFKIYSAPFHF
jgi:NADH:ubiquinone oxidoreductase subunit 2 (subunit N)